MLTNTIRMRLASRERWRSSAASRPRSSRSNSSYPRKVSPLAHILCRRTNQPTRAFLPASGSFGGPFSINSPLSQAALDFSNSILRLFVARANGSETRMER